MDTLQGGLVFLKYEVIVAITIFILIILQGKFLSVIIIAGHCRPAELSMMQGICAGHNIVKVAGAYEAQVVVHSLQVINHSPFILAFFPAPWAENWSATLLQGLGEWIPFRPMILGNSVHETTLKKQMSLEDDLTYQWVALRSFWLFHDSCTPWISLPRQFVEVAISWKVE